MLLRLGRRRGPRDGRRRGRPRGRRPLKQDSVRSLYRTGKIYIGPVLPLICLVFCSARAGQSQEKILASCGHFEPCGIGEVEAGAVVVAAEAASSLGEPTSEAPLGPVPAWRHPAKELESHISNSPSCEAKYFHSYLKSARVQGGQREGRVLPAPRIIRSGAPLVAAIAIVAPTVVVCVVVDVVVCVVVVVVVAVVVEHDGLRLSARGVPGPLPGIGGGRGGCPPVEIREKILTLTRPLKYRVRPSVMI